MDLSFLTDDELAAVQRGDFSSLPEDKLKLIAEIDGSAGTQDMATELAGLPPEIKNFADQAMNSGDPKMLKYANDMVALYGKVNPSAKISAKDKAKDDAKNDTVDDVVNAIKILKDVETYPDPLSLPAGWIQNIGEKANLNPELSQYNQKSNMLLAPIAKGIQGEVGNLSEFEQKSAKAFLPQGKDLFSKSRRSAALENLFASIKARTGRDLSSELDEDTLKSIGATSFLKKKLQKPQPSSVIDLNQFRK